MDGLILGKLYENLLTYWKYFHMVELLFINNKLVLVFFLFFEIHVLSMYLFKFNLKMHFYHICLTSAISLYMLC